MTTGRQIRHSRGRTLPSTIAVIVLAPLAVLLLRHVRPIDSPRPQAPESSSDRAGVTSRSVELSCQYAETPLSKELVTLHVGVANHRDRPLRLAYSNFVLHSGTVRRHPLPPYPLRLVESLRADDTASFEYVGLGTAPYYAPVTPQPGTPREVFVADGPARSRYTAAWRDLPLPPEDVRLMALPERILPSGTSIAGLLFFEPSLSEAPASLLLELEDAATGHILTRVVVLLPNV